jgi:CTP synthase (UTP-ammonia lyase)
MGAALRIGLVGDRDDSVTAHRAIPLALAHAAEAREVSLEVRWLPTESITHDGVLAGFQALWCVPASPYRSMDGALRAIRFARENGVPFLGSCGGFQHVVIEFARNVLGWADAEHAETSPDAARPVVVLLECALVEARETLRPVPGSRLASAYGAAGFEEGYRCRYGLNPAFAAALLGGPLRVAATGAQGDVRAVELDGHPFFVATLFQPERAALDGRPVPLARALVEAAVQAADSTNLHHAVK